MRAELFSAFWILFEEVCGKFTSQLSSRNAPYLSTVKFQQIALLVQFFVGRSLEAPSSVLLLAGSTISTIHEKLSDSTFVECRLTTDGTPDLGEILFRTLEYTMSHRVYFGPMLCHSCWRHNRASFKCNGCLASYLGINSSEDVLMYNIHSYEVRGQGFAKRSRTSAASSVQNPDDMCEVSLPKRSPTFNFFGWFGKASQRVVQAMKSLVTCSTILESDDNFAEYVARILGEPNRLFIHDSQESSPSACSFTRDASSSFRSDISFSQYFTNALRVPSPLRLQGGEDQTPSSGPVPLKACSSSKSDNSFAEYLANAIREHDTLDFRDNQDETLSNCSIPQEACLSHPSDFVGSTKSGVNSGGRSLSACFTPQEVTSLGFVTPPDVWSNRNGGQSPIGFVGKLDANTSSRLAAICMSEKSQIFERPPHPSEGPESAVTSTYVKIDQCQCIGENMISSVSSAQPKLPSNFFDLPTRQRLRAVKQFLSDCEYRLNSLSNFQIKKQRPLVGLMATAKLIIHQPEPIKCVEAVFVALYLTAGLQSVERIPLGFKTQFANQVFQHIVLLVQHKGKYGAFGMSRSPDLMNKDICYDSMSSIIENFKIAYEESDHTILKLQIGLPVEHNIMSSTYVCWEHVCLCPANQPWPECVAAIENHALRMEHLWNVWVISGRGADPTRKPSKILRKPPLNNGLNRRVKPMVKKASTLRKSSVVRNRCEDYQVTPCRPTSTYTPSYQSKVRMNETHFQNSHKQRNAPVSINKSLLKSYFNPRDSTGPWKYTQCPKHHHQGIMCGENEEYSVIHIDEYGSIERHPLALEDRKFFDCGNLLCQADSKLLDENRKISGSGPLYSMVLQKSKSE